MNLTSPRTPLLGSASPLDARAKAIISELFAREEQLMAGLPSDDPLDGKRRRRVELTLDEIEAQPQVIRDTLDREKLNIATAARLVAGAGISRVYMTGCGDSLACMVGMRSLFEELMGVPCEPVQALDLAYYYHRVLGPDALVIALSSSGATTRTVEAMMIAKARGAHTLGLSNTPGSALMTESDSQLTVHAARRGWPTQASTAAMALLGQFALAVAGSRDVPKDRVSELQAALDAVPDQIGKVIADQAGAIAGIARREADRSLYLFAGGGPSMAAAMFGAAKVRECSPDHALAIPLEEFHHYNSQKAGDPLFIIAPAGPSLPRARDTALEGDRWGGQIYAVVSENETRLDENADTVLRLPSMPEPISALVYTVPVQLFAYHVAMEKFAAAELAPATTPAPRA